MDIKTHVRIQIQQPIELHIITTIQNAYVNNCVYVIHRVVDMCILNCCYVQFNWLLYLNSYMCFYVHVCLSCLNQTWKTIMFAARQSRAITNLSQISPWRNSSTLCLRLLKVILQALFLILQCVFSLFIFMYMLYILLCLILNIFMYSFLKQVGRQSSSWTMLANRCWHFNVQWRPKHRRFTLCACFS